MKTLKNLQVLESKLFLLLKKKKKKKTDYMFFEICFICACKKKSCGGTKA